MINQDQINSLTNRVEALKGYLDIDRKKIEIEEEELKSQDPNFWDNPKEAEILLKKIKQKKFWVEEYNSALTSLEDLNVLFEFNKEVKKLLENFSKNQKLLIEVKIEGDNIIANVKENPDQTEPQRWIWALPQ